MADEKEFDAPKKPVKKLPKKVKLIRPHGFYDENGEGRHWFQGQIVDDPNDIQTFIDRGFEDFEVL